MAKIYAGIVHGDIKPENVLVFREKSGEYCAKVIDFGYSAWYIDDKDRLEIRGTEIWNAPEHGSCPSFWTLSEAINSDIFSFGMLCFWLLFNPYFPGTALLPEGLEVTVTRFAETMSRNKRQLETYARQILEWETVLAQDTKVALGEFFSSSLSQDPDRRKPSLPELIKKLAPDR